MYFVTAAARPRSKSPNKDIINLIHSANTLFLILGIVGFLLSLGIYLFGTEFLPQKFGEYEQYSILFLLGGTMFLVTSAISIYTLLPNVLQRFDLRTKIGIVSLTLSSVTMLAIVEVGGKLKAIFVAN